MSGDPEVGPLDFEALFEAQDQDPAAPTVDELLAALRQQDPPGARLIGPDGTSLTARFKAALEGAFTETTSKALLREAQICTTATWVGEGRRFEQSALRWMSGPTVFHLFQAEASDARVSGGLYANLVSTQEWILIAESPSGLQRRTMRLAGIGQEASSRMLLETVRNMEDHATQAISAGAPR